jgi:lipid-A-disaccharide synthase
VILPFEKEFFKKFDWQAEYVGNPVLDAVKAHKADDQFISRNQLNARDGFIALLPGSRKQELKRIIPLMAEVARREPNRLFGVAAVNNLDKSLYAEVSQLKNVKLIFEDTYNLLLHATAAIVTSGTATLETALFRVPQVVVYKANVLSYWVAKRLIRVSYISLVNLIAGKQVVSELIQSDANPEAVTKELNMILGDKNYRNNMLDGYNQVIDILDTGSASENTARLMVNDLNGVGIKEPVR